MIEIIPTEEGPVTRISCHKCGLKVRRIGLRKGSNIDGLTFKCEKCGTMNEVKTIK